MTPAATVRIVAGSGRSGTTWVLDALAEANALRPVFEPLHPRAVPEAADLAGRYVRSGTEDAALGRFFDVVLDGSLRSVWIDYRVRPDRLRPGAAFASPRAAWEYLRRWRKLARQYRHFRPATRRPDLVVKSIRANLMLGWLHARYAARIVLVLRHPGAVVESRLRLAGDDWDPHALLRHYLGQSALQEDYLFKYNNELRRPLSAAEAHAATWCIENQLPLEQLGPEQATVVFYEHLVARAHAEWRRVTDALALREVPDAALLARPSQQSSPASRGAKLDEAHSAGWMERLDSGVLRQIEGILTTMGVTAYGIDDPMPRQGTLAGAGAVGRRTE